MLKSRVIYKYFEEGMSVPKIAKEFEETSLRVFYLWVQQQRDKNVKELNLSAKEKKELKGIEPSPGFKNAAEELKYLRLLKIMPRLLGELKKKDKPK